MAIQKKDSSKIKLLTRKSVDYVDYVVLIPLHVRRQTSLQLIYPKLATVNVVKVPFLRILFIYFLSQAEDEV